MNINIKNFMLRGLMFGGLGPIIVGIVYAVLSFSLENFSLSGNEVCLAIISSYILAFVQAGASIFNQIEQWSVGKALFIHLSTLYLAYIVCYLINSWIPFEWMAILIFTIVFVVCYLIIWFIVYLIARNVSKKLNEKIN